MFINDLDQQLLSLCDLKVKADEEYIKTKHAFKSKDALKKSYFAILMSKVRANTKTEKESEVLKSKDWNDYVKSLIALEYEMDKARHFRDKYHIEWETYRSIRSNYKKDLEAFGG